jgi:hypothetical protein
MLRRTAGSQIISAWFGAMLGSLAVGFLRSPAWPREVSRSSLTRLVNSANSTEPCGRASVYDLFSSPLFPQPPSRVSGVEVLTRLWLWRRMFGIGVFDSHTVCRSVTWPQLARPHQQPIDYQGSFQYMQGSRPPVRQSNHVGQCKRVFSHLSG